MSKKNPRKNNRADAAPRQEVKMYAPNEVIIIGIDTPDDPAHWGYDKESNDQPLVEADVQFTYEHGIIQNVLGRRDGDKVVIVAGRGRTRQLREANARRVKDGLSPWFLPVRIVKGDHKKMLVLKHGENSHRRELNPYARARQAYELSQQMSEEEAATVLGLGVPQFRAAIKLLDLAPAVVKLVVKGDLAPSAAVEFSALSEVDQTARLAEVMASAATNGKRPTARDVKAKLHEANGKALHETPSTRIKKAFAVLEKLADGATKDDLWAAIKKVRAALKPGAERAERAERAA